MFVQLELSCNRPKLEKALNASRAEFKNFYGITDGEKEEILFDVMYRFEMDKGKFPVSVYKSHCRNKIIGFLGKKTAQKRMASQVVEGKRVFIHDISLSTLVGEDSDTEFGDTLEADNTALLEAELLSDIERINPELLPLVKDVLGGKRLTKAEREYLKQYIKKEDLM